MNITISKGKLEEQKADLLVINCFSGWKEFGGATKDVDDALDGALSRAAKDDGFKGGLGQIVYMRTNGVIPAKRVLLIGLGEKKHFDENTIRQVSATALKSAKATNVKTVVSILHGAGYGERPAKDAARAQFEGVRLATYEFDKKKKKVDDKLKVTSWVIVSKDGNHVRNAMKGIELGNIVSRGVIEARDLVNEPAQELVPEFLAEKAQEIAKASKGKVKVKILDAEQIKKARMGGLYGVGQGSENPPYFIHLQYKPAKAKKRISLIGKGVTFDSGGLSLKPAEYMTTMKCDMAGSAAVLGVFSIIAELSPNVHVDGIIGAAENMPSGNAIRPGDVLRARNGKTMEVLNTDAEGRLTLADSLSYASELKPNYMIDLATLTGACVVALGEEINGLMGNDAKFSNKVLSAAADSGESMWELPLEKRYNKLIKSKIADVKNIGGRYGGALTAGLFLQNFVGEKIPWVHLDIAGPAFAEREINAYTQYGGTGAGVPTLIELLNSL